MPWNELHNISLIYLAFEKVWILCLFSLGEYFILGFFFMKVEMTLVIRKRRYIEPDRINTVPFHLVPSKIERREIQIEFILLYIASFEL